MTDIMTELFDHEEVLRSYVESERYEAAEEAEIATKIETAKRFLKMGKLSVEEVAVGTGLSVGEVKDLAGLPLV